MSRIRVILPDFKIENSPPFEDLIRKPENWTQLLENGGFVIQNISEGTAEMVPGKVDILQYHVELPPNWSLRVPDKYPEHKKFLVDEKGQWRGRIETTCAGDPVQTFLYCRYSQLRDPHPSWYDLDITWSRDEDVDLVVDRACTSLDNPGKIIGGVLWKLINPRDPNKKLDIVEATKSLTKYLNKLKEGIREPADREPWIWLEKNYPLFENPFAYW